MQHAFRINLVSELLKKIVPQMGATLLLEPEYEYAGMIRFASGKQMLFRGTCLNINPAGAVDIAKDKDYSKFFLRSFGYIVPEGKTFFSEERNRVIRVQRDIYEGLVYAKKLGFPVVIKPNNSSQGNLVMKVYSEEEYMRGASEIFLKYPVMLVEKWQEGRDFRIVVLDDRVISAYERVPFHVEGDGVGTIRELVGERLAHFEKTGRGALLDPRDGRVEQVIKREGYTWDSVLPQGVSLSLLDNANLSTGGTSVDYTTQIHPEVVNLAIAITRDMGLRLCGVDVMLVDITKPLSSYCILEVNAAPGLDNYARMGDEQMKRVEDLYLEVLRAIEQG